MEKQHRCARKVKEHVPMKHSGTVSMFLLLDMGIFVRSYIYIYIFLSGGSNYFFSPLLGEMLQCDDFGAGRRRKNKLLDSSILSVRG